MTSLQTQTARRQIRRRSPLKHIFLWGFFANFGFQTFQLFLPLLISQTFITGPSNRRDGPSLHDGEAETIADAFAPAAGSSTPSQYNEIGGFASLRGGSSVVYMDGGKGKGSRLFRPEHSFDTADTVPPYASPILDDRSLDDLFDDQASLEKPAVERNPPSIGPGSDPKLSSYTDPFDTPFIEARESYSPVNLRLEHADSLDRNFRRRSARESMSQISSLLAVQIVFVLVGALQWSPRFDKALKRLWLGSHRPKNWAIFVNVAHATSLLLFFLRFLPVFRPASISFLSTLCLTSFLAFSALVLRNVSPLVAEEAEMRSLEVFGKMVATPAALLLWSLTTAFSFSTFTPSARSPLAASLAPFLAVVILTFSTYFFCKHLLHAQTDSYIQTNGRTGSIGNGARRSTLPLLIDQSRQLSPTHANPASADSDIHTATPSQTQTRTATEGGTASHSDSLNGSLDSNVTGTESCSDSEGMTAADDTSTERTSELNSVDIQPRTQTGSASAGQSRTSEESEVDTDSSTNEQDIAQRGETAQVQHKKSIDSVDLLSSDTGVAEGGSPSINHPRSQSRSWISRLGRACFQDLFDYKALKGALLDGRKLALVCGGVAGLTTGFLWPFGSCLSFPSTSTGFVWLGGQFAGTLMAEFLDVRRFRRHRETVALSAFVSLSVSAVLLIPMTLSRSPEPPRLPFGLFSWKFCLVVAALSQGLLRCTIGSSASGSRRQPTTDGDRTSSKQSSHGDDSSLLADSHQRPPSRIHPPSHTHTHTHAHSHGRRNTRDGDRSVLTPLELPTALRGAAISSLLSAPPRHSLLSSQNLGSHSGDGFSADTRSSGEDLGGEEERAADTAVFLKAEFAGKTLATFSLPVLLLFLHQLDSFPPLRILLANS